MSDRIEEISKHYRKNVLERSRGTGLYTIPESPESEAERGMWSTALDVIVTALRYLAPATLITLFWGQESFFYKLLKRIDSAFRSLLYSSDEQKQSVLQWVSDAGTVRVDKLDTVWRHGWIVCGILDIALPGACTGHPPTKCSLKHAQSIAEDYLGVEPTFSNQDLEAFETLDKHQEWKLITFLDKIRSALEKLPSAQSKTVKFKNAPEDNKYIFDYIARGSGLIAAQLNNKASFKIYPLAQQSTDPGEITITIQGPENSYGMKTIPAILGKAQQIRQNLLGQSKSSYTENFLPITQGAAYLRTYGKTDISKTYYIPQTKYKIQIETENQDDHVKISYTIDLEGTYDILITSKNRNIPGSPFNMTATKNIVGLLEKDSFCLEDGEEIDIVDITTERKVILRIVDFVTEKMLLRENGLLEKISEDEAKQIMESEIIENKYSDAISDSSSCAASALDNKQSKLPLPKLYYIVNKIKLMIRGCKAFQGVKRKDMPKDKKLHDIRLRHQKDIPDIVNSTFNDSYNDTEYLPEIRDKYIIPKNIEVSLLTEIPEHFSENIDQPNSESLFKLCKEVMFHSEHIKNYRALSENMFEDDNASVDTINSTNNPFIHDTYDPNYETEKKFGSFNKSEYETNNSQNEETQSALTKLLSNHQQDVITHSTNPFTDIDNLQRTVSLINNVDQNPFFIDDHSCQNTFSTDFIIGAPVSLPPLFMTSSDTSITQLGLAINHKTPEIPPNPETKLTETPMKVASDSTSASKISKCKENMYKSVDSTSAKTRSSSVSPKSEMWDSAYVSIDDNNSTSEIITESIAGIDKQKMLLQEKFTNIESIQKELWGNRNLADVHNKDDVTKSKYESKRSIFKPIREEHDNKCCSKIKNQYNQECDSVTDAFAELDDIYEVYFSTSDSNSTTPCENNIIQSEKIDFTIKNEEVNVNSASEMSADVKRQTRKFEGKISEVQANVTESFSASQNLLKHIKRVKDDDGHKNNVVTQFGDIRYSNIVLEKKKYWDDKIQQIEAKSEAQKVQQSRKRIFSKHMRRNDSLSKRKGRKIVENFLNSNELDSENQSILEANKEINTPISSMDVTTNSIELNSVNSALSSCHVTYTNKQHDSKIAYDHEKFSEIKVSLPKENTKTVKEIGEIYTPLHLKQEVSDQVFRAFETSPKRFFGTSRQQILNKIDTFIGKPNDDDCSKKSVSDINHETGLVSSRISMFHDISNTEPLSSPGITFKSIQQNNISVNKDTNNDKASVTSDQSGERKKVPCKAKEMLGNGNSLKNVKNNFEAVKKEIINFSLTDKRSNLKNVYSSSSVDIASNKILTANEIKNDDRDEITRSIKKHHISFDESNKDQNQAKIKNLKVISKSEMDIFNKMSEMEKNDLEKHKSYDELPKVSVKNFISLFEDVSKTSKHMKIQSSKKSPGLQKKIISESSMEGTTTNNNLHHAGTACPLQSNKPKLISGPMEKCVKPKLTKIKSIESDSKNSFTDFEIISNQDKESNCLSLSDIEIEIIDTPDDVTESSKEDEKTGYVDYKNRFKLAKQYFQSLEELRVESNPRLNKDKTSSNSTSNESLENKSKIKKSNIKKSHTMPSAEISKIWSQMHEHKDTSGDNRRLVKISEKFNVDDLFEDVMEGRLSRQGSLRGIPHKKAVLETFRSMENICDKKLNSYELAVSQESDFVTNKVKSAQTYLSEYPYLPTTDPSQYHSRLDADASGLITFKELLKTKPRRNSVPDIRVNPLFSIDF